MKRIIFALLLSSVPLMLAGCGDSAKTQDAYLVKTVEQGDISCYIELEREGAVSMHSGDFEICKPEFVGQRVTIETSEAKVQSEECQGDPECTLSETVELIVKMTPVE